MKIIPGNLISLAAAGDFDVIFHGCNCFCTQGAGIARQISSKWPAALQADKTTKSGDRSKLGSITVAEVLVGPVNASKLSVVNAYTQYHLGRAFELPALESCCKAILRSFGGKNLRFGAGFIGAGIGGGDWNKISKVLESAFEDENLTIVKWDGTK